MYFSLTVQAQSVVQLMTKLQWKEWLTRPARQAAIQYSAHVYTSACLPSNHLSLILSTPPFFHHSIITINNHTYSWVAYMKWIFMNFKMWGEINTKKWTTPAIWKLSTVTHNRPNCQMSLFVFSVLGQQRRRFSGKSVFPVCYRS